LEHIIRHTPNFEPTLPKSNNRPRGRVAGALPCNNPHPDWRHVFKGCIDYLGKNGRRPFLGPVMERAIFGAHKVVYSNHTTATCRAEGWNHRHPLGLSRDITLWKVLFATVNLGNAESSGDWFLCAVHAEQLNRLSSLDSLTRTSHFLSLYRRTGFLKCSYKQSQKGRGDLKYCIIRISKAAFLAAGITHAELEQEIARKRKNDAKRRNTPGTREYEYAQASMRRINRETRQLEDVNRKARKAMAIKRQAERLASEHQQQLRKEAYIAYADYQQKHPTQTPRQSLNRFLDAFPQFKYCFDTQSTN